MTEENDTQKPSRKAVDPASAGSALLAAIKDFRTIYDRQYQRELEDCEEWQVWCKRNGDTHGMNFHQGRWSAHVGLNITMSSLLTTLEKIGQNDKAEAPSLGEVDPPAASSGPV